MTCGTRGGLGRAQPCGEMKYGGSGIPVAALERGAGNVDRTFGDLGHDAVNPVPQLGVRRHDIDHQITVDVA